MFHKIFTESTDNSVYGLTQDLKRAAKKGMTLSDALKMIDAYDVPDDEKNVLISNALFFVKVDKAAAKKGMSYKWAKDVLTGYIGAMEEATAFDLEDLRKLYYKVSDGAWTSDDVIEQLKAMPAQDAKKLGINIKNEIKIFSEIKKLIVKSDIGAKL